MKISINKISVLTILALIALSFSSCKEENGAPYIVTVVVTPDIVEVGQTATVTVDALDPENDLMEFEYEVVGGYISGYGNVVQWTAPATQGVCLLTVTVSDGIGGSSIGNGTLTVIKPPTQIKGTASFPGGVTGELGNSVVSLYNSKGNWLAVNPMSTTEVEGVGSSVSFTLDNLEPNTYYLDVWSDNDNNSIWSIGDYIGWYGSGQLDSVELNGIVVEEGQTVNIEVTMREI